MKPMATAICLLAATAVAGTSAVALAAKPMTQKERKAKAEQVRQNHRQFQQPRTIAQAEASAVRQPDGSVGLAVPAELWNQLSVTRDADGNLHLHESEGASTPAAAQSGGCDHE
jgi:hypothetical protein